MLEHNVTEYSQIGNVIICGDLNARTGTEMECTDFDSYVPTSFDHVDYHLPFRSSHDSFVNERGRYLIDFCISHDLHFLNGRTVGDLNGKFTCFQYNGNSVVDYCIISNSFSNNILYFMIHDHVPILSDHAKLTCQIKANFYEFGKENHTLDSDILIPSSYIYGTRNLLYIFKPR